MRLARNVYPDNARPGMLNQKVFNFFLNQWGVIDFEQGSNTITYAV